MKKILSILILCLGFTFIAMAQDSIRVPVTDFDPELMGSDVFKDSRWSELKLPKRDKTNYSLIEDEERIYIKAESNSSASGLVYKIDIDPKEFPILEWSWKVNDVLENGDITKKSGDDYPARIYITFDYDKKNLKLRDRIVYFTIITFTKFDIPLRGINYVWANKADVGTIVPSSFTDWVYMIAVQSGNEQAGTWQIQTQNIYEDYKRAFGEEPPRINGIAIMTDSDNTKGFSEGYYGDIIFKRK